jgi:hypothetical protein
MRASKLLRDLKRADPAGRAAERKRENAILAQVRKEVKAKFPNITTTDQAMEALAFGDELERQLRQRPWGQGAHYISPNEYPSQKRKD